MPAFRRVEDNRAGGAALGVLVPHGLRTVVILRPRSVPYDLLPLRPDPERENQPRFCDFDRDGAANLARQLIRELEYAAQTRATLLGADAHPVGEGYCVGLAAVEFAWLACRRAPGQPYQPALFGSIEEAERLVEQLAPILHPAPDAEQEYYFNTQHFNH